MRLQLKTLLSCYLQDLKPKQPERDIRSIHCHSLSVEPLGLFVALEENTVKRILHIRQALDLGASVLFCPKEDETNEVLSRMIPKNVECFYSSALRQDYALLSATFYENPSHSLCMIGVTGTNGKTSTTHMIKFMLEQCGKKVGLIGTNENIVGDTHYSANRTTPDPYQLHGLLRSMVNDGCTHVVMEVSSHGLVQQRTAGILFQVGIFTNLTQDHLDYHHTMEEYKEAKSLLFAQSEQVVLNVDDPIGKAFSTTVKNIALTYGQNNPTASVVATHTQFSATKSRYLCHYKQQSEPVTINIPGKFTLYNSLAAICCGIVLQLPWNEICHSLSCVEPVKGRVELVPAPCDFTIMIDYAHTPDALENVLTMARSLTKGRLICLFGCGGNRDKEKRPQMAAVAQQLADILVITSDNPRFENPEEIIEDIVAGLYPNKKQIHIVPLRKEGIFQGLSLAQRGDFLILAGKGHECYQEIQGKQIAFDERLIVAEFFSKMD